MNRPFARTGHVTYPPFNTWDFLSTRNGERAGDGGRGWEDLALQQLFPIQILLRFKLPPNLYFNATDLKHGSCIYFSCSFHFLYLQSYKEIHRDCSMEIARLWSFTHELHQMLNERVSKNRTVAISILFSVYYIHRDFLIH